MDPEMEGLPGVKRIHKTVPSCNAIKSFPGGYTLMNHQQHSFHLVVLAKKEVSRLIPLEKSADSYRDVSKQNCIFVQAFRSAL